MATRYQDCFAKLAEQGHGAFVPFVTLGDPTPELSLKIIQTLVESGADALELGIPFSDPLADGPTIQNATLRAMQAGATTERCFQIISQIRAQYPDLPIGLLMYANLIFAPGIDNFYAQCAAAGVDSVLVADVPVEMSAPFTAAAKRHGIDAIFIAPPNGDEAMLKAVANAGSGYTYLLSRAGVTGAETAAEMPVGHLLDKLKAFNAPPPLLGFGISRPEQVKQAINSGAAGAISGSAVVKIIENNLHDETRLLEEMAEFIASMKAAT